jgi:hypothetical protein
MMLLCNDVIFPPPRVAGTPSPIETWPVDNRHLEFTTQAAIVPSTFPFDDCAGEDCYGTLV